MHPILLLLNRVADARLPAALLRALCEAATPAPLNEVRLRMAASAWHANPAVARHRYGAIAHWNVARVRSFAWLFCNRHTFNEPIGRWDTRRARTMCSMFDGASTFDQPLFFNTRRVRDMRFMFANATAFNQPLFFDTRRVRSMASMFCGAAAFNQPLPFNTRRVRSIINMFRNATAFNQSIAGLDLRRITGLDKWLHGATHARFAPLPLTQN